MRTDLNPQNPYEKLNTVTRSCTPSSEEVETGGSLGLTGQSVWSNGQATDPNERQKGDLLTDDI